MNIGIFGNSFADDNWKPAEFESWVDILRKEHNIDNYALSCTSIWFSYNKFIENYTKYDKNIFIIAEPNYVSGPENTGLQLCHVIEPDIMYAMKNNVEDHPFRYDVEFFYQYFLKFHNTAKEEHLALLMIDNIRKIAPECIIYPSMSYFSAGINELALSSISSYELSSLQHNIDRRKGGYLDIRVCHFIKENHPKIAKIFKDRIDGIGTKSVLADFDIASGTYVEEYFSRPDYLIRNKDIVE